MTHTMHATLFISDAAASQAAHAALRKGLAFDHATIHRRIQRDRDTQAVEHGWVVKLVSKNGSVSYA